VNGIVKHYGKKKGGCVGLDGKTLPLFVGLIANNKLKMGLIL
jgi:hypothetical protein